jgi:serine/threonine protein kinase
MTSITLPFYAPAEDLPAKLPTKEDVDSSKEFLSGQYAVGKRVVGIGSHFIVKYGPQVDLVEGQTMILIKHETSLSVPKVYALFQDTEGINNYIIMERVKGDVLNVKWPSLSPAQKQAVASQLKASFEELRKLPSPGGYCRLGRMPLRDDIFAIGNAHPGSVVGPFDIEAEFTDALIKQYADSDYLAAKPDYYRRSLPTIFKDHPPTFTHGDIQKKNILIDPNSEHITIIDWEFAGWWPSYWEYTQAIYGCMLWEDDWNYYIDSSLDAYRNEYAWMQMLHKEIFPGY